MDPRDLPQSRASGFVLTRERGGQVEYLVLTNRRDGAPGFPKGHRDGAEDDLRTALRETREETGLTDLEVVPGFREEIAYRVRKAGELRWKTVVYFRARLRSGDVTLSDEHTAYHWHPLADARARLTFDSLREVLRRAALHAKDPALFALQPPDVEAADRHLASLPAADDALLAHLRGGARLARAFAEALRGAGVEVDPEAAAAGTLLHDVGRALGRHDDHQVAGAAHLRDTPLAPYGFACVTHFTKGAARAELVDAGVALATVEAFEAATDLAVLRWEERCAALADACMKGPSAVPLEARFADLRRRYGVGAAPVIALQKRRAHALRAQMQEVLGRDPLAAAGVVGG